MPPTSHVKRVEKSKATKQIIFCHTTQGLSRTQNSHTGQFKKGSQCIQKEQRLTTHKGNK